jgi:hypothetical protein
LEYALTEKAGGDPAASMLEVDLTAAASGRALSFRLVDRQGNAESAALDAHLDAAGGMSVSGDGGFSDREEVLLSLFELSFENLARLEKGAKWARTEKTPDGSATTTYEVQDVEGSLLNLSVKHEVSDAGWTSTWQGKVVYNVASSVPTRAELSGESAIEIKLASDSFGTRGR